MEKIRFIRDTTGDVARDNVRNWRGWPSQELQLFALRTDLDDVVSRLTALLDGDPHAVSES
jgi:hypothetical protein